MDISVLYIIPNDRIIETVQRVMQRCDVNYPVYYGTMSGALEIAKRMIAQGSRVIVSTGLTALYLRKHLSVPVLELLFTNTEFARAIQEGLAFSDKILIVASTYVNYFVQRSLELFQNPTHSIQAAVLSLDRPFEEQVQEYLDQGDFDVVISSTPGVKQARINGKIGILFDVDEKMVEFSIQTARSLLDFVVHRAENDQLIHAVMNYTQEGLIITDRDGIISQLNASAERIIGTVNEEACGQNADQLLANRHIVDSLTNESGLADPEAHPVVLQRNTIQLDGKSVGILLSIHDMADIRMLERSAKRIHELNGHVATWRLSNIIGKSEAISQARQMARRFSQYNSTVLILGETGTGKVLFAQGIHNASPRRNEPFLAINCAALPEQLLESELFGYVKGAFTGARSNGKTGLFEAANGGTIFLDEISEIPPNMQARLLRVIQERQVVRIGDDKVIPVDIRILAASNRDLRTLVQQGAFRADLYYRLSVLELKVPPLSWRREDIPLLAQSLLQNKNKALNTHVTGFAPEALEVLQSLEWPGNIRQLSNFIERLMILSDPPLITGENARALAQNEATKELPVSREGHFPTLEEAESNLIRKALDQTGGSRTAAAQLLGIHPSTLWRKLRDFDTEIPL